MNLTSKEENLVLICVLAEAILLCLCLAALMVCRWGKTCSQSLPQHILDSFPISQVGSTDGNGNDHVISIGSTDGNGNDCAICLDGFMENDIVRELRPCSHVFHRECIDLWLARNTCCPICRRSLL
ncbi:hypothetical protein AMTRI_Chr08g161320 [Amborella trichopoda]